jgi:hypothetical protein
VLIGSHVDGVFITDLSFSEYTQIPVPGNARVGFAFGIPEPSEFARDCLHIAQQFFPILRR